jgi:hypothetical protein
MLTIGFLFLGFLGFALILRRNPIAALFVLGVGLFGALLTFTSQRAQTPTPYTSSNPMVIEIRNMDPSKQRLNDIQVTRASALLQPEINNLNANTDLVVEQTQQVKITNCQTRGGAWGVVLCELGISIPQAFGLFMLLGCLLPFILVAILFLLVRAK